MARPDVSVAKWVGSPASFTQGRRARQPSVIVIHATDNSEGPTAAEDGAAYDRRRTDGVSTHFFVDSDSIVQEVELSDEAHAARTHGNDIGVQIEICGLSSQSASQWSDAVSEATLRNVARLCAQLRKVASFPLVRLSPAQLRSAWNDGAPRGFCGHVDVTNAFPEDNGTHTDPGAAFPWSRLFDYIRELEDDMPTVDEIWGEDIDATTGTYTARGALLDTTKRVNALYKDDVPTLQGKVDAVAAETTALGGALTALSAALAEVASEVAEIKAAVVTPPPPA